MGAELSRIRPDGELLRCVDCGAQTTRLEASRRRFNENRCGRCNGRLEGFNFEGWDGGPLPEERR